MKKWLAIGLLLVGRMFGQTVHAAGRETNNTFTGFNQFTQGAELGPVAFASLAASPNGTIIYVTDGSATNPCTGSGTGAFAQRTNGAWNCASSGGGAGTPGGSTGTVQFNNSGAFGGFGTYNSGTQTLTLHNIIADNLAITSPYLLQSTFPGGSPSCPAGFTAGQTCIAILSTGRLAGADNGSSIFLNYAEESTTFAASSNLCTDSSSHLTTACAGGTLTGSGASPNLAIFTGANSIGSSGITESGSALGISDQTITFNNNSGDVTLQNTSNNRNLKYRLVDINNNGTNGASLFFQAAANHTAGVGSQGAQLQLGGEISGGQGGQVTLLAGNGDTSGGIIDIEAGKGVGGFPGQVKIISSDNSGGNGYGFIQFGDSSTNRPGIVRLEPSTGNSVFLEAQPSGSQYFLALPTAAGTTGQFLTVTNGTGTVYGQSSVVLGWAAPLGLTTGIQACTLFNTTGGTVYSTDCPVYETRFLTGSDPSVRVDGAIANLMSANTSITLDMRTDSGTWTQGLFERLYGQGMTPSKTGVILLPCDTISLMNRSLVIPSGWTLIPCGRLYGGTTGTTLRANAGTFRATYTTGTANIATAATIGGAGASWPNTYGFVVAGTGTTWTTAMIGMQFGICDGTVVTGTGCGGTHGNSAQGLVVGVPNSTTLDVITRNTGLGNTSTAGTFPSGVNYILVNPLSQMGDTSGAVGNPFNYDLGLGSADITGTLDCAGVLGCSPIVNMSASNLATVGKWVLLVSDGPGLRAEGAQSQNSGPYGPFWILRSSTCLQTAMGILLRSTSTLFNVATGTSIALGDCTANGVNEGIVNDSPSDIEHVHVGPGGTIVAGTHAIDIADGNNINLGAGCTPACFAAPGNSSGSSVSDINVFNSTETAIHIGTVNSPSNIRIQEVNSSSGSMTNLLKVDGLAVPCVLPYGTPFISGTQESTLNYFFLNNGGDFSSSSTIPGCAGITMTGPITVKGAGNQITSQGGFVDLTVGFLTNTMGTQTTATPTAITGMSWNLLASKSYTLNCYLIVTFAPSATIAYELVGPGSPTHYTINAVGPIGAAAIYDSLHGVSATTWAAGLTATSGAPGSGVTEDIQLTAGIQNGSTAGAMTLDTIANGTNTIQNNKDSWCVLTQVN